MNAYKEFNEYLGYINTKNLLPYIVGKGVEIVSVEQTEENCRIDAIATLKKGEKTYKLGIENKNNTNEIYIKEEKVNSSLSTIDEYGLCGVLYFAYIGLHNLYVFNLDDIKKGKVSDPEWKLQRTSEWNENSYESYKLTYKLDKDKAIKHLIF